MGGARSTFGERKCLYMVLVWKPEEKRHLEDPGVDGRIILRLIFRKWFGGMLWIDLAQNRDRWRTLVNGLINVLVL